MRDLLNLAQVNVALRQLARQEVQQREKGVQLQVVWRKDFIRFMNQTYTAAKNVAMTRHHVFGSIWDNLFFRPQFVIVCYSPDVFEYEIRLQVSSLKSNTLSLVSLLKFNSDNIKQLLIVTSGKVYVF